MSDKILVRISYEIPKDVPEGEGALPPVSKALNDYILANRKLPVDLEHPSVGLEGANRGEGKSKQGGNTTVPFSFEFPKFKSVTRATLALKLTPGDTEIKDDGLQFTNHSKLRNTLLGNDVIRVFMLTDPKIWPQTVNFDLTNISNGGGGFENLSELLREGTLDVIYRDDGFIHSIALEIEGVAA